MPPCSQYIETNRRSAQALSPSKDVDGPGWCIVKKRICILIKPNPVQVTFYMVGDNATVVRHRLEEILVERKKFVCLNDDMRSPEPGVSIALGEFFEAYYPKRSPYVYFQNRCVVLF